MLSDSPLGQTQPRLRHHTASQQRSAPYNKLSHPPPNAPLPTTNSSTWQQLVVHASSAAGTTAAVVSEESMKCLKYCLSWLQYAIQHIEQQMTLLRNFLVSLATSQSSSTNNSSSNSLTTPASSNNTSVLSTIKKDIVDTLRKVVDVISRYAGNSLPQNARVAVRGFILNLPGRWATVNDIRSTTTSPAASPMLRPSTPSTPTSAGGGGGGQEDKAIRLLTFGQESVDMLQSVSSVFGDTVERAELWIDRFRSMRGIPKEENERVELPPIRNLPPPQHHQNPPPPPQDMDVDH
ncbi:transcription factor Opi1-domain-containing protein [Syncephalastrum racemosum]|uniref:Transcription factor Opi1-domain-containing protein n=1 Tax=Syncephalastrum racemosum TaxID=13706 RepID=A0A1X2H6P6_SYNRA|nr:transcription factor Opi1-domain-containing protein [Syncephalastrum racemosum]